VRPFRLELEGFGPYLRRQVVDFSDVELFAITGPTGSGKSTLLEAIAFALFKRTPRGQSLEELRHPAAQKVRVLLDFQVGEGVYRVVRHLEPQGGRLLSQDQLFRQEGTEWQKVETAGVRGLNQTLEALLGLTYEAFTKALLLPQGEFDRLLKGEARERRDLLQSLFGLEHLEKARDRAKAHADGLKNRLSGLEGELRVLEGATPEALGRLLEELQGLEGQAQRLAEALKKAQRALEEAKGREEYWVRRQDLEARLRRLEGEAELLRGLRERLERAGEARRLLPLYEELRALEEALKEVEGEISKQEEALRRLEQERQDLKPRLQRLGELEGEIARLQELKGREALLKGWRVGLDLAHPRPLPATEAELFALWEEVGRAERWEKREKELKERREALKRAEEELKALEEEGKGVRTRLEALRREEAARRKGALLREKDRLEGELLALRQDLHRLEEEKARLEEEKERLGLHRYHALLEPGKPCPLCGQVVGTLPPLPPREDPAPRLRVLEEERRRLLLESARREERLRALEKELEPLEGVEAGEGGAEELYEEIRQLEDQLSVLREEYREKQGRYKALREEVARLEEEAARLEPPGRPWAELWEEWQRRLAGFVQALREATGGGWPSEREAGLRREKGELEGARRRLEELAQEEAGLRERLSLLKGRQERLLSERARARERVEGLPPEEELRRFYLEEDEEAALRGRLERHEQELQEVKAALVALGDPPGPPLAPGERGALEERLSGLEEERKALEHRIGGLKERIAQMEAALRRRLELEKEKGEVLEELGLWQELLKDLLGHNFPAFLLGYYQRELLARAGELLRLLSKGRYRFGSEGDRFLVVDAWTEVERPVHTLSGGETFQASLALALALSEQLSRGRLMALFLDEGFGSLDPESLEEAASVLETLPTRGRLVGVVTHVEALAQRLPAQLRVRKHPSGSSVEWVVR
jgi:exonuclease SbcC